MNPKEVVVQDKLVSILICKIASSRIQTQDLTVCLWLNLKHCKLDHSTTTAGFAACLYTAKIAPHVLFIFNCFQDIEHRRSSRIQDLLNAFLRPVSPGLPQVQFNSFFGTFYGSIQLQ